MHAVLSKQICDFQSFINSRDYDIIAINETWLSNHTYTNEILPKDYNVFRKDRDGRGGGVFFGILKDTIFIQRTTYPQ